LNLQNLYLSLLFLSSHFLHANDLNIKVLDHQGKPLKNMVVYAEPNDSVITTKSDKSIEIAQLNKSFAPYISVIQAGNQVSFHNQDDITHHIYSPLGANKFEFKIKAGNQKIKKNFTHTGEVVMGCNIHDWMSGYLLILDTPYFAKTDDNGAAKIPIDQSGAFSITLWHPQMNEENNRITRSVKLPSSKTITMQLTQAMAAPPQQKNEEDFDFLSDY